MGDSLNTTVNGSAGTCDQAADFLRDLGGALRQTGDGFRGAVNTAKGVWHGPAHDTFVEKIAADAGEIDSVRDQAADAERALRDFAGGLRVVLGKMNDALGKAAAGGLHVEGPFITSPDLPPAAPILPTGPCGTPQAVQIMQQNQQAIQAHNQVVADYNAKAAVFNECKAIVRDARTLEDNTHFALEQAMGAAVETTNSKLPNIGFTVASQARSFVGTMENGRRLAAAEGQRLLTQAAFYEKFALGKLSDAPEWALKLLVRSGEMAEDGGKLTTRANQFDKWIKIVPQGVRDKAVAYLGKSKSENLLAHTDEKSLPSGIGRFVRAMPYAGAVITAGSESMGALKGEQSWMRAGANAGASVVGGALGGAVVGAVAGSTFTPVGSLILGVMGGFGGAKFASDIVEGFSQKIG